MKSGNVRAPTRPLRPTRPCSPAALSRAGWRRTARAPALHGPRTTDVLWWPVGTTALPSARAHACCVAAAVAQLTPGGVQLPHLLFYGPPGTGKTSAILALAKDLFGPQMYRSRVLELNASDERGIEVVRNKIKHFASLAVSANKSTTHPCPPFKLIILDEADSMTVDAQSALRRTMETYTKVTRFCILCNYVSRIIGPIASRCAKFRFQPMCKEVMTSRLSFIADKEGFSLPQDAAQALLKVSGGDLRRAITLLQNTYMLHGQDMKGKHITDAAAVIPDEVMLDLLAACKSNSFDKMQVCACAHVCQCMCMCVCVCS